MHDPFAQANPWTLGAFGNIPFGYGMQQGPYSGGLGVSQWQSPFGYQVPQAQFQPQTWLGSPQYHQYNPTVQQLAAQQIPQIILEAQRIAQQVPLLIQQLPQLFQQNPQLAQQAPQLQQIPMLLQQAADICQRVPQVLQAVGAQPYTPGAFGAPMYPSGVGRPFGFA
jgi:hypothetical protein